MMIVKKLWCTDEKENMMGIVIIWAIKKYFIRSDLVNLSFHVDMFLLVLVLVDFA